jgi:hypothetical protein
MDDATVELIERGNLKRLYDGEQWSVPVGDLVTLCRTTREQLMIPCLRGAAINASIDPGQPGGRGPRTVREVLMHVITSWVYHSGQVGLLTLQNGLDYVWAFA